MKKLLFLAPAFSVLVFGCSSSAPVAEAPPPAPEPAPVVEAPAPAPEPTEEEKAAAAAQEKLAKDIAKMEADAEAEKARWTPEMHEAAGKLASTKFWDASAALRQIQKGTHRVPGNAERDAARHPDKTLAFLGVKPEMTVLEYGPGGGWYTELLAPLLATRGKLICTNSDPKGPQTERATYYGRRFELFTEKAPEIYGKIETVIVDGKKPALPLDGTVDMALVVRGMHGWQNGGTTAAWLAEIHKALKPGGVLGVVQHRAKEGADPSVSSMQGYLPEQWVIDQVTAAGFELSKKSDINANPKDTANYPDGVWTLPPSLRLGDVDKEKYVAIGESDRMTLRFVKPKK